MKNSGREHGYAHHMFTVNHKIQKFISFRYLDLSSRSGFLPFCGEFSQPKALVLKDSLPVISRFEKSYPVT